MEGRERTEGEKKETEVLEVNRELIGGLRTATNLLKGLNHRQVDVGNGGLLKRGQGP